MNMAEMPYMKAVELITQIIKNNNDGHFQQNKNQLQEYFEVIQNEKQLNMLQMMIEISKNHSTVAHSLETLLKDRKAFKQQQTDVFLKEVQEKNKNGIGISFLNNNGEFIISDEYTRKLLEIHSHPSKEQNLFSYSSEATLKELNKQFINPTMDYSDSSTYTLLGDDEFSKEFKMTIYSPKTQKNAMKKLGNYKDMNKEKFQELMKQKENRFKHSKQFQQISEENKFKIICLKSLSIKFLKLRLQVDSQFSESIKNQNNFQGGELLEIMVSENQQQFVVKCEIKQISDFENIPNESIYQDTKIMEFSLKWKKKLDEQKRAIFTKFSTAEQQPAAKKKNKKGQKKQISNLYMEFLIPNENHTDQIFEESQQCWAIKKQRHNSI